MDVAETVETRKRMHADLRRMTRWAAHCPANFRHLQLLMQAEPLGPEPVELFAESETDFFSARGFGVTFHKSDGGAVTQLTVHFGGQDIEAKKIP